MKKKGENTSVVILGGGINALGIIRSFEKTDIPVVAMSWYRDYGMSSRFCRSVLCPDPLQSDKLIDFLMDYGSQQIFKPVLYATSDLFLMPVVENKTILEKYYHIPVCDWDVLSPLIKKDKLYPLAEALGVLCPKTQIVNNKDEWKKLIPEEIVPCIVKPTINIKFSTLLGAKAFVNKTTAEFNLLSEKILQTELCDEGLVIQEFIPGDVNELYTITSYANSAHEIMGYSIGHKIRQFPPETGTIISGKLEHVEEIYAIAKNFIKLTKFYGISNIEFKKDIRDASYKLMEINPRTGVWNLSALESGVNLPLMAYNNVLGKNIEKQSNKNADFVWMISLLDFYYSIWGYKKKGFVNFSISFNQWRKSITGKKVDACYKWYDPVPFIKGMFMKYK